MKSAAQSILLFATLLATVPLAHAQTETAAQICSSTGGCAPVDPLTALAIIGIKVTPFAVHRGPPRSGERTDGHYTRNIPTVSTITVKTVEIIIDAD